MSEVAGLLAEHGEAFAAYANNVGVDDATAEGFQDSYRGYYDSEKAFAEELVSELYSEKELGPLANYIDYESYANDPFMGDFYSVNGEGGFTCSAITEQAVKRRRERACRTWGRCRWCWR